MENLLNLKLEPLLLKTLQSFLMNVAINNLYIKIIKILWFLLKAWVMIFEKTPIAGIDFFLQES